MEIFEIENLASDPEHAALVAQLHEAMVAAIKSGLVPPIEG
jgi:hypothetical protein